MHNTQQHGNKNYVNSNNTQYKNKYKNTYYSKQNLKKNNDNDAYHNGYETMVTAFCFALLTIDCETVGFFLKISKEIGKAWRKSLEAYF